jgi:hypothetical protein
MHSPIIKINHSRIKKKKDSRIAFENTSAKAPCPVRHCKADGAAF